jgi:hypothetical protein
VEEDLLEVLHQLTQLAEQVVVVKEHLELVEQLQDVLIPEAVAEVDVQLQEQVDQEL